MGLGELGQSPVGATVDEFSDQDDVCGNGGNPDHG